MVPPMKTFSTILFALAVTVSTALAADWPDFRGPNRDGVYAGGDIPAELPAGGPPVVWEKSVGQGFSNPVVANGRVILFHRVGAEEVIEALELETGKTLWKHAYATKYRDDFGFDPGPRASPVVAGGQVYTFGAEGVLTAVAFATGKRIWQINANEEFGVPKGFFGAAPTPLIDGNRLFLNVGGPDGAGVVAFDRDTGRVLWKATDHEASYSSAVAAEIAGKRRIVFFTREGLVITDPATGNVFYEKRWRARSHASVNAAAPVVSGDIVFLTASYGTGSIALRFKGEGEPEELWAGEEPFNAHYATPVVKDGVLYGFHGRQEYGQSFRALELETGKVLWSEDGMGAGTVTLAGDLLIILRENGELVIARANPKKFDVTSRAPILPNPTRAYPALSDGLLLARDTTTLVCLRLKP